MPRRSNRRLSREYKKDAPLQQEQPRKRIRTNNRTTVSGATSSASATSSSIPSLASSTQNSNANTRIVSPAQSQSKQQQQQHHNQAETETEAAAAPSAAQLRRQKQRQKICKTLLTNSKSARHVDVDHLVQLVEALIEMNKEIWDRCLSSRVVLISHDERDVTMKRIEYSLVTVDSSGKISVTSKLNTKDFGAFDLIPKKLLQINPCCNDDDTTATDRKTPFPDYTAYFEKALLLHDDVLGPFLKVFKRHLEKIQVYLGKIETWLMEPEQFHQYLKDIFDDYKIPDTFKGLGDTLSSSDIDMKADHVCFNCCQKQTNHRIEKHYETKRSCKFKVGSYFMKHPNSNNCMNCSRPAGSYYHTTVISPSLSSCTYYCKHMDHSANFFPSTCVELFTCNQKGTHNETFDMSQEIERSRLQKFVEFMKMY